jgi:threonine dehydrogenase-like Zn-dependent dehydrogenase
VLDGLPLVHGSIVILATWHESALRTGIAVHAMTIVSCIAFPSWRFEVKAVSYEGPRKVSVSDRPKPKIKDQTDAILRVTTSGICGSDLHMYDGRTPLERGTVVGHEIMGVIDQVGGAVKSIKKGDRVVLPFNIACGFCFNCHRGYTNACLTMIDAVGYQARDDNHPQSENPTQALENCLKVVNPTGAIGMIGVYIAPDPGAKDKHAKNGIYPFPLADYFDKAITMGSGQAPVKKYNEYLRDLTINGKAKPSQIVSHRIEIGNAPEAYEKFDKRIDGYTKVLIKFVRTA